MPKPDPSKQRGRIIIDRSFQYRFLIFCLAMTVLLLLIFSAVMLIIIKRLSGWWSSPLVIEEITRLLVTNGLFILLVGAALGVYALFISHRIAGPAYRLKTAISRMIKGEYEPEIKLRRKDYLSDLARALNELSKKLKLQDKLICDIRENALKLKEALSSQKDKPLAKDQLERIILDTEKYKANKGHES